MSTSEGKNCDFLRNFTFVCEDGVEVKAHAIHIVQVSSVLYAAVKHLHAQGSAYTYDLRDVPIGDRSMSEIGELIVKISSGAAFSLPEFDDPELAAAFINVMEFFLFNDGSRRFVLSRIRERYPRRVRTDLGELPAYGEKMSKFAVAMFEVTDSEQRKELLLEQMNMDFPFDFAPFKLSENKERVAEYVTLLIQERKEMDYRFVSGLKDLIESIGEEGDSKSWEYFDIPLLLVSILYAFNYGSTLADASDCVNLVKEWTGQLLFEAAVAPECLDYMNLIHSAAQDLQGHDCYSRYYNKYAQKEFSFTPFAALVNAVQPESLPVFSAAVIKRFFHTYTDSVRGTFVRVIKGKLKDYARDPSIVWDFMDSYQKMPVQQSHKLQPFVELIIEECVRAADAQGVRGEDYLQDLAADRDHLAKLKTVWNKKKQLRVPGDFLTTKKRKRSPTGSAHAMFQSNNDS